MDNLCGLARLLEVKVVRLLLLLPHAVILLLASPDLFVPFMLLECTFTFPIEFILFLCLLQLFPLSISSDTSSLSQLGSFFLLREFCLGLPAMEGSASQLVSVILDTCDTFLELEFLSQLSRLAFLDAFDLLSPKTIVPSRPVALLAVFMILGHMRMS